MWRFFAISVVVLLSCCVQGFSGDIRVSAFPAAVFSQDGTSVYYVQSDLHANVRRTGTFSPVYARNKEIRIVSEVVSIHKCDLATGKNETVATLPVPPWSGTGQWVPRIFWFDGEAAKMWWSPDGELQYEVHGPTTTTVNRQGIRETRQAILFGADAKWTDSPFYGFTPTLRTALKYVVSGSMELITSWRYGDYGSYYLVVLDHDRRTARLLATGSDWDRKRIPYSYESVLYGSRIKGPVKD
jgi:hypothetical protein